MKSGPQKTVLISALVGGAVALLTVFLLIPKQKELKFVKMTEVFAESKIKQKYEKELTEYEQASNAQLKDVQNSIRQKEIEGESVEMLTALRNEFKQLQQDLSDQYTEKSDAFQATIWAELNTKIEAYGKKMGYVYILGAKGDGSIMYAQESEDVTKEVIEYINQ